MKNSERVGIILAGGKGTRLNPATKVASKQLLPIYDKPMIYYPMSTLMLGGLRKIIIISDKTSLPLYKRLFSSGKDLGIELEYVLQDKPRGIADAFIVSESIASSYSPTLILGDNIFFGNTLGNKVRNVDINEATIFAYHVNDPKRYGVANIDSNSNVISLEEKPSQPKSNFAVTGLYSYDKRVYEFARSLQPSNRGELEITDLNNIYLKLSNLKLEILNRGFAWLDSGTFESLREATNFVANVQNRQNLMIGCLEEIAYRNGWINKDQLLKRALAYKNSPYGEYLMTVSKT